MRGPQKRVGAGERAARNDAAVRNARRIRHIAVEPIERVRGQIVQCADVDDAREGTRDGVGDEPGSQIGERRPEVRRADGHQRQHALAQSQPGDRIPRVESAHAVGDDVDALARQLVDELAQALGTHRHGCGRRHARRVELRSGSAQTVGDLAEVAMPAPTDVDLVEPEHSVGEHHRMPEARRTSGDELIRNVARSRERHDADGDEQRRAGKQPDHRCSLACSPCVPG